MIPESTREGVGKLRGRRRKASEKSMIEWLTSVDSWCSLPLGSFEKVCWIYFNMVSPMEEEIGLFIINSHPSLVQLRGILGYLAFKMNKLLWQWRKPLEKKELTLESSISHPNHLPRAYFQIISHLGLSFNIWIWGGGGGGDTNIQPVAFCLCPQSYGLLTYKIH